MQGRSKCCLTDQQAVAFVKPHVKSLEDRAYKEDDWEDVVQAYSAFLCACAGANGCLRLTSTVVSKAVAEVHAPGDKVSTEFG